MPIYQEIFPIFSASANREKMTRVIAEITGDSEPFFCPADFVEGEPYKGHAHVFPISELKINEEVDLDK